MERGGGLQPQATWPWVAERAVAKRRPPSASPRLFRRTRSEAVKIDASVTISITVATALITGETPKRSMEKILSGSVVEVAPETKNVSTKSSKEKVKASSPPARMAGYNKGIVIRQRVRIGVAPRSWAPSPSGRSL